MDWVEDGIYLEIGLIVVEGWEIVWVICMACYFVKLVIQNKVICDGWKNMIVWMQEMQGFWDLGDQEKIILDYLVVNYVLEELSCWVNFDMDVIEWYIFEL